MGVDLRTNFYRILAKEISGVAGYFDRVIQVEPLSHDTGELFRWVSASTKENKTLDEFDSNAINKAQDYLLLLLNGNLNHSWDIEDLLSRLRKKILRNTRIAVVAYNPYLRAIYHLLIWLGVRQGPMPTTFLTTAELENLTMLSGFQVMRRTPMGFFPFWLGGIGYFFERLLSNLPILRRFGLVEIIWLRPQIKTDEYPSISIVIPARNERGNIESALQRIPSFGNAKIEVIFVEGHSKDKTWEEIERAMPLYSGRLAIQAYRQTGVGKADAVRLGFSKATGEIVTILDADLTMPPELLVRFYDVYREGYGDFINGSRLLYPMEGEAMRFLNHLGNIFFAKALSYVLSVRLGDSLCGTKLFSRRDYVRFQKWRERSGDFDPFGDFELLFPASFLCLGIVDIPIRYRARTYGQTNIHRFWHGLLLLKMTMIGFLWMRLGWSGRRDRL